MIPGLINRWNWWAYQKKLRAGWRQWDRLGGGKQAEQQLEQFQLLLRPSFNPVATDAPALQDAHYQAAVAANNWCRYQEYAYHLRKPCWIEPEFGYVVMEPSVLVSESLAWSYMARTPNLLHLFSGLPSLEGYQAARRGEKSARREPIVISLRHVFDSVYSHFLVHLLPALFLLDECGVSPDIPIVVSGKLGRTPFFQEMTQRGALRNRRWIVQEDSYIHSEEVIFAATDWPSRVLLHRFLDAVEAPSCDAKAQRRFFILRKNRQLSNMDALLPIAEQHGFEPLRPEEHDLGQQMALFSQAQAILGVTGSGLTNTIFRRDCPTQILEIASSADRDIFFYNLANTCGHSHQVVVGSPYETRERSSNFSVEPERFRTFVENAVATR